MSTALWGVGTFVSAGEPVDLPVAPEDFAADTAAAGRALASLGIGPGDRVLIVGLVSECAHLVPFHAALRARGAILSGADATIFDAPRTAKLTRQLGVRAVLGVNGAVLDGLVAEGTDLLDVFGTVPIVGARPDAVARLRDAGVAPVLWAHVGPTVAVECAPGRGAHVDEAVWEVAARDGAVALSPRAPRALPPGPYPVGAAGVARGACPCGRAD
ncbi:MAG TPA: hypothetical protein VMU14_13490, partial [Acidimicrobiales bacterium]|nr:hypothetical protein [Acidimicrobiales bacterium]